jgi:hypothetical protein
VSSYLFLSYLLTILSLGLEFVEVRCKRTYFVFYGGYMMEFDELTGLELQYAQEEMHKHFILEEMVSLCMQYGYEPTMDDFRNRLNQAINRLIPVVDTEV